MNNIFIILLHNYSSKSLKKKLTYVNTVFFNVIHRIRKYSMNKKKSILFQKNTENIILSIEYNPYTNIKYSLPENAPVSIAVYDLNGREVDVLINAYLSPGYYSTKWDASGFPSGVYFIEMVSDDFQEARQVLLIK